MTDHQALIEDAERKVKEAYKEAVLTNITEPKSSPDPKSTYYDAGGIPTIDIIKAKLTSEQYIGYLLGNIIKYSCRLNFKDQFERDLEKIGVYEQLLKEEQS